MIHDKYITSALNVNSGSSKTNSIKKDPEPFFCKIKSGKSAAITGACKLLRKTKLTWSSGVSSNSLNTRNKKKLITNLSAFEHVKLTFFNNMNRRFQVFWCQGNKSSNKIYTHVDKEFCGNHFSLFFHMNKNLPFMLYIGAIQTSVKCCQSAFIIRELTSCAL